MRRPTLRTIAKIIGGITLSLTITWVVNHLLQEHYRKITISKETTYVLGPTFPDGYVNFLAALDAQFSQGVTPENNAAIPIFKAIGFKETIISRDRPTILAALHMQDLPDNGTYFFELYKTLYQRAKTAEPGKEFYESDFYGKSTDLEELRYSAPWTAKDDPVTAEWLSINATALQLTMDASKCSHYYFPILANPELGNVFGLHLQGLGFIRSLANALSCRGMLALGNHDFNNWREDFLALQRLGRLLAHAPHSIQGLLGLGIVAQANSQLTTAIPRLSGDEAKTILADLRALPPMPDLVDCLDYCQRLEILSEISIIARFGPVPDLDRSGATPLPAPAGFGFQPPIHFDDLMRQHNQWMDALINAARRPKFSERDAAIDAFSSHIYELLSQTTGSSSTQAIQRLIFDSMTHTTSLIILQDRARQNARLAQLATLLHIYYRNHKAFPATLADLQDSKETQLDLFNDDAASVHYRPAADSFLIYSIGPNRRDDGGIFKKPNTDMKTLFNLDSAPEPKPNFPDDILIRIQEQPF